MLGLGLRRSGTYRTGSVRLDRRVRVSLVKQRLALAGLACTALLCLGGHRQERIGMCRKGS